MTQAISTKVRLGIPLLALCLGASCAHKASPVDAGCTVLTVTQEGSTSFTAPNPLITVDFHVVDCSGTGVPGLSMGDGGVLLKEDGVDTSALPTGAGMVGKNQSFASSTLVLVDLSSAITNPANLPVLKAQLDAITAKIDGQPNAEIGIYAFDGRSDITTLRPFGATAPVAADGGFSVEVDGGVDGVVCPGAHCGDATTNLYGAIINGAEVLENRVQDIENQAAAAGVPVLAQGNLVIVTDGTDRAERFMESDALNALAGFTGESFAIGVGTQVDAQVLTALGRDGFFPATDYTGLGQSFDNLFATLQDDADSHYVLLFCTDRRNSGIHSLEIDVKNGIADGDLGGLSFNSSGFAEQNGSCAFPGTDGGTVAPQSVPPGCGELTCDTCAAGAVAGCAWCVPTDSSGAPTAGQGTCAAAGGSAPCEASTPVCE